MCSFISPHLIIKQVKNIINKTIGNNQISQVPQLNLGSVKIYQITVQIKKQIQRLDNLSILHLCQCELFSLKNMPDLNLMSIDLTMNKIRDQDIKYLTKYKSLVSLNLSQNFIIELKTIQNLSLCQNLNQLTITQNPIAKQENYQIKIFKILKSLQILNQIQRDEYSQVRRKNRPLSRQIQEEEDSSDVQMGQGNEDNSQNDFEDEDDYSQDMNENENENAEQFQQQKSEQFDLKNIRQLDLTQKIFEKQQGNQNINQKQS